MRGAVALGGLVSVVAALHISGTNLNRAYYGTDTRAYQLLAGALLALTPRLFAAGERNRRRWSSSVWSASPPSSCSQRRRSTSTPSIAASQPRSRPAPSSSRSRTHEPGVVAKGLSQPVAAYLGRLSYGTYLWHWPVIFVLTRETSLGPVALFAVTCVLATALAATSYHVLELRIRQSPFLDRYPRQVIAVGLTLSLLGGLVVVPAILDTKHRIEGQRRRSGGARLAQRARADIPTVPDCSLEQLDSCTVAHGKGLHVLLLGDSNARMFIPTFTAIAERENLTLSVAVFPLCPWQAGLFYLIGVRDCKVRKDQWYGGLIDALDPDVIVVADRPIDDPARLGRVSTPQGLFEPRPGRARPRRCAAVTESSLACCAKGGRKVVIIEPIPIAPARHDPLNCLSSATKVEQCIYQANTKPTPLENMYASQVKPGAVWTLDLDRVVCPRFPTCDPVVRGLIVKRDTDHITGKYADDIGESVDAILRAAGVLP